MEKATLLDDDGKLVASAEIGMMGKDLVGVTVRTKEKEVVSLLFIVETT